MNAAAHEKVGKFGRIALELKLVNAGQIQECLAIQMDYERSGREVPKLGTILLAKGYLDSKQVKRILDIQKNGEKPAPEPATSTKLENYPAGTAIFREGESGARDMFLLQSGTVELRKRGVRLYERSGEGSFFGITSCLLKVPRTATAIARTPCRVYRIPADKISEFFKSKPALAVKLAALLAENLFSVKNRLVEAQLLAQRTAKSVDSSSVDSAKIAAPSTSHAALTSPERAGGASATPLPAKSALRQTPVFASESVLEVVPPSLPAARPSVTPITAPVAEVLAAPAAPASGGLEFFAPGGTGAEPASISAPPREKTAAPADDDLPVEAGDDGDEGESVAGGAQLSPEDGENAALAEHIALLKEAEAGEGEDEDSGPVEEVYIDQAAPPPPPPADKPVPSADPAELEAHIRGLSCLPFAGEVVRAVEARVELLLEVEVLEEQRQAIETGNADKLNDRIKNELGRQRREVQRIPPLDSLQSTLEKLQQRLNPAADDGQAANAEPLEPLLRRCYEIACVQKEALIRRAKSTLYTLRVCAAPAAHEPLYHILHARGLAPENLFGWGIYALALREYGELQPPRLKDIRKEIDELQLRATSKGFLGLGKKKNEDIHQRIALLEAEEKRRRWIGINVNRELNAIEKSMVDEFWKIYRKAMLLLVGGVKPVEELFLRAFLRWGLLGHSARWLPSERCIQILRDCAQRTPDPVFNMDSTHICFADELICFIAQGKLPPTSNEDLELNHRNTPMWRADRAWRRIINCRMQEGILRHILLRIQDEAKVIREDQAAHEREMERIQARGHDKERRRLLSQIRHQIQNCKVKAGRLERLAEKIIHEMLPKNENERLTSTESLKESGIEFSPADLAEHEIKCMRRNARLVAKLKEPFLPFTLRDRYKPDADCVNTREAITTAVREAEVRDPLVFQEPLVPSAKKIHRILMRISPIIVVAPAGGILGFMMGPRAGMDCGRFVVPAYFERTGMREEILWNVISDFRFDTSKASAGVDIMNSDTLVAAYAEVRWNLRKKDKETRQKAAIYMEENERTNWRRHYSLYMKSALDSGKLLFYKCPELYELIINKFVDLPGGCEMLKR